MKSNNYKNTKHRIIARKRRKKTKMRKMHCMELNKIVCANNKLNNKLNNRIK